MNFWVHTFPISLNFRDKEYLTCVLFCFHVSIFWIDFQNTTFQRSRSLFSLSLCQLGGIKSRVWVTPVIIFGLETFESTSKISEQHSPFQLDKVVICFGAVIHCTFLAYLLLNYFLDCQRKVFRRRILSWTILFTPKTLPHLWRKMRGLCNNSVLGEFRP